MISAIWSNLKLEILTRRKRVSTYMYLLLMFTLPFLMVLAAGGMWKGVSVSFGLSQKVMINSPYAIHLYLGLISLFGTLILSPVFGLAVCKDYDAKFEQIVFTTPVHRTGLYLGRFLGAALFSSLVFASSAVGFYLATLLPGLLPSLFAKNSHVFHYIKPYLTHIIPNILLLGSLFFGVAALTKRMAAVYVTGILVFMGYLFSVGFVGDIEQKTLRALADPFGNVASSLVTKYWSVADQNARSIPLESYFLWNRVFWLSMTALILGLGIRFTRSELAFRSKSESKETELKPIDFASLATPKIDFAWRSQLRMLIANTSFEIKAAFKNAYFLILVFTALLYIFSSATQMGTLWGTDTFPVTYKVLDLTSSRFSLFMLIILVFYSGELLWRERQHRFQQIFDALPFATGLRALSKFLALQVLILSLLGIVALSGIVIQLAFGYTHFELGQVFSTLLMRDYIRFLMFSTLFFFLHTLANNKILGHTLCVGFIISTVWMPTAGFQHRLYRFASAPGFEYSDMNGFGPSLAAMRAFQLYWGLAAAILLLLVVLLWPQGTDQTFKNRLAAFRSRCRPSFSIGLVLLMLGMGLQGYGIYQNTNVLNVYRPAKKKEELRSTYEKRFKAAYAKVAIPQVISVKAAVDIFPKEGRQKSQVDFVLKNESQGPIEEFILDIPVPLSMIKTDFSRDLQLVLEDKDLTLRVYRFKEPLAPGDSFQLNYQVDFNPPGYTVEGRDTKIVENGSFFNNGDYFPSLGYDEDLELSGDKVREQYGLKPKARMPPIDDQDARQRTYMSHDGNQIDFEATVSTDEDQIAIAPGYLQKEWVEGGRRYFHYKMDQKILNFYAFLSGRYEVKRDRWNDVSIEIYYHKGHEYNLDRMLQASKDGLEYYSKAFGPYQHRQFRIIEFPRYADFAQSFPNTIPFSESIGFIAKVDDKNPKDLDYPYYVTAHELAHQWWGHQVVGADVQGATLMSESLCQYSAMMLMEHRYGRQKMERYLKHEMDSYLGSRSSEQKRELPLSLNENQSYIHYNKGSVAMYALKDRVGEEALNKAIRNFADTYRFQKAPYVISTDFLANLKKDLGDGHHAAIDDLLNRIIVYDNQVQNPDLTKNADGSYTLVMEVKGVKYDMDDSKPEAGNSSTSEKFAEKFELRVLAEGEREIYSQRHVIHDDKNVVKIQLPEKPDSVHLDPLGVFIDQNRDDNKIRL